MPTNEWSISGCLKAWRGWTSSLTERLKAGLGTARAGEDCAACVAAAVLCSLFSTFFEGFVEGFGDLYGETAARARPVEKWRARSDKRRARFEACDESILFNVPQSRYMRVKGNKSWSGKTPLFRGIPWRLWLEDDSKIFLLLLPRECDLHAKRSVWIAVADTAASVFPPLKVG